MVTTPKKVPTSTSSRILDGNLLGKKHRRLKEHSCLLKLGVAVGTEENNANIQRYGEICSFKTMTKLASRVENYLGFWEEMFCKESGSTIVAICVNLVPHGEKLNRF